MKRLSDAIDLFSAQEIDAPQNALRKRDLEAINNLKQIFRDIRDYFAGNVTGITRDEAIAQTLMRLLFCKIHDELSRQTDDLSDVARRPSDDPDSFARRVLAVFERVKTRYADIFAADETIDIPPIDLWRIVAKFERFSLTTTDRDVIADAFEELIGRAFRGGEGQFFTPRNVVQMMIDVLEPSSSERIIDPACGSGGFLAYILRHLLRRNPSDPFIVGIDKDAFLSRLAKIYLSLIGDRNYHVHCENSLADPQTWKPETQAVVQLGSFDVVLTNPPFGAKIPVVGDDLLKQYDLGRVWIERDGKWQKTKVLMDKQSPQILFIERCLQLLKAGGRTGIVLPDGVFGNPSERYVWEFARERASIIGVVSLSQETFQPSAHTKTSVAFLEKKKAGQSKIFMAIAKAVGHNKNGKETFKINPDGSFVLDAQGKKILDDDLPEIAMNFKAHLRDGLRAPSRLGFAIGRDEIRDHIFIPECYNPEIQAELARLEASGRYELRSIGDLVADKIIEIRRGNEIGSQFYGTGNVPFVRTTDIVNWEIKIDPVKPVSEEVYEQYRKAQDVRANDILFVNDGTFLIGRSAMVTRLDEKIVIQSHLRKIRVLQPERLNPFYLFYLLNSKIARKQIDAKTFVQATISTIGNRLFEVVLPIAKSKSEQEAVAREVQFIIEQKTLLREKCVSLIENSL
ncbi:MAG: N-6 DNA methylase [Chloroherpetonaceae bacterium]|nr:N-6 DNA methylase [Chloroherpetonaceae bacterium]MDW8438295.1 N-6 DNA methylase [Chloroherpetonaceae bacterium]